MDIADAAILFEAGKGKCFAFWFAESGTFLIDRCVQDHDAALRSSNFRMKHTIYRDHEPKSFSCRGCIRRVTLAPGQIEIEPTSEGRKRLAIEDGQLTIEFSQLSNQDFSALRIVLKAIFSDTDILVCIAPQDEELNTFRTAVLDRYHSLGLTLSTNRAAVMRAMSEHFPASKMRTVYKIISEYEHPA